MNEHETLVRAASSAEVTNPELRKKIRAAKLLGVFALLIMVSVPSPAASCAVRNLQDNEDAAELEKQLSQQAREAVTAEFIAGYITEAREELLAITREATAAEDAASEAEIRAERAARNGIRNTQLDAAAERAENAAEDATAAAQAAAEFVLGLEQADESDLAEELAETDELASIFAEIDVRASILVEATLAKRRESDRKAAGIDIGVIAGVALLFTFAWLRKRSAVKRLREEHMKLLRECQRALLERVKRLEQERERNT